jgi:hypothetical protein
MHQFSLWDLLIAFLEEAMRHHPWLSGLLGWLMGTLVWEGLIKAGRARRGLAHMLHEEMMLNALSAVAFLEEERKPGGQIPANVHFSSVAFEAVTARLAELPRELVGFVITYYDHVGLLNRVEVWRQRVIDIHNELLRQNNITTPGPIISLGRARAELRSADLDHMVLLSQLVSISLNVLPRLFKRSSLWGGLRERLGRSSPRQEELEKAAGRLGIAIPGVADAGRRLAAPAVSGTVTERADGG